MTRAKTLRALFGLEWGELLGSRSFWLFLLAIGPLVGQAFLHAVSLYAEASGAAGGPAALAQGLSPLDGVFVPAFGAYDLAVTLLYPFVAIRLVAEEKTNGAGKLLLQSPASIAGRLGVKLAALVLCYMLAWLAGLLALLLWKGAGGHVHAPELATLLLGHFLRFLLATAVALAAASVCEGAASAAIACSRADEAALRRVREPVTVTVNLAPEDPRLFDLERGVLTKLRRVIPGLTVRMLARTRSGLFERGGEYGEVWYQVGSRRAMVRSTIEPVVLERLYALAGIPAPSREEERAYPGYPLAARLPSAANLFFGAWPLAVGLAYVGTRGHWRKKWKDLASQSA